MKVERVFEVEKETKNTVRYTEVAETCQQYDLPDSGSGAFSRRGYAAGKLPLALSLSR